MTAATRGQLERRWARLGALINVRPAARSPDLERLLLDTAREIETNARLLPVVVSWLVGYGGFVARHRLGRLITTELQPRHRPALGLILDASIAHGALRQLAVAMEACVPASPPRPLFAALRESPALEAVAERGASIASRRWGVWAPEVELKRDAIRPIEWVLAKNPEYRARIVRKGDLRCSILEALRRDAAGCAQSEAALARLCGATRAGVRRALVMLVQEGEVTIGPQPGNRRDHAVTLRVAA